MTTIPLTTLAAGIDATGISAPTFADILATLQYNLQQIFGPDIYLGSDSQDGQMIGVFAAAVKDANDMAIAAYNSFSPITAQGNGLSSNVKLNGITRLVASNSTVDLLVTGQPGTILNNALAADSLSQTWALDGNSVIPPGGQITVTATATVEGALAAGPGTVTIIQTPILGWQAVTNPLAAVPGAPVESDAALRQRQSVSTSLPAQSVMVSIYGALANLPTVTDLRGYENWTDGYDAYGIPPHSFSFVVEGGDDTDIAQTIATRKPPGTGTFGSTSVLVTDQKGMGVTINFFRPTVVRMVVQINIRALAGYVSTTGTTMAQNIADYVNGLGIGEEIFISQIYGPANAANPPVSFSTQATGITPTAPLTFNILSIQIARFSQPLLAQDVPMAFNEMPSLDIADITVNVS